MYKNGIAIRLSKAWLIESLFHLVSGKSTLFNTGHLELPTSGALASWGNASDCSVGGCVLLGIDYGGCVLHRVSTALLQSYP